MKVSVVGRALWGGWLFPSSPRALPKKAPCCQRTSFPGENVPAASFELLQWNDWENSSALCSWNYPCSLSHGPFNLLRRRKGRGPAPGRGPSHPCPPSPPALCSSPPGDRQDRDTPEEEHQRVSLGIRVVWDGPAAQVMVTNWFCQGLQNPGVGERTHESLTPFQGTETPHFNKNCTLLDVITDFCQFLHSFSVFLLVGCAQDMGEANHQKKS